MYAAMQGHASHGTTRTRGLKGRLHLTCAAHSRFRLFCTVRGALAAA